MLRRLLIAIALLTTAAQAVTYTPITGCKPTDLPLTEFPVPPVRASQSGQLQVDLTATLNTTPLTLNGTTYNAWMSYTDKQGPPSQTPLLPEVWRLNPGDTLLLTLTNSLGAVLPFKPPAPFNCQPKVPDPPPSTTTWYTNLHYHGFNVAPGYTTTGTTTVYSDDVFAFLTADEASLNYEISLPSDHPIGMFWYHPHPHGVSETQVLAGLSGVAMVGDIRQYYPAYSAVKEKYFLLRDFNPANTPPPGATPLPKLINGTTGGTIEIDANEVQLWDFANIGADAFFDIAVIDMAFPTPNRVPFYVLSVDGNPTIAPSKRSHLFLNPGGRMQALVQIPDPGYYELWSFSVSTGPWGDPNPPVKLGYVHVNSQNSSDVTTPLPPPAPAKVERRPTLQQLQQSAQAKPWVVDFGETVDGTSFTINGVPYGDPKAQPTIVPLGVTQRWKITNHTQEVHVFHIHQLDYVVESVNGVPQAFNGYQDTVTVPAMDDSGKPGEVDVLIPFTDPLIEGWFVYHCHILNHEDLGMMANICVSGPRNLCTQAPAMLGMSH